MPIIWRATAAKLVGRERQSRQGWRQQRLLAARHVHSQPLPEEAQLRQPLPKEAQLRQQGPERQQHRSNSPGPCSLSLLPALGPLQGPRRRRAPAPTATTRSTATPATKRGWTLSELWPPVRQPR